MFSQCDKTKMDVDKFTGDTSYTHVINCSFLTDRVNITFVKHKNDYVIHVMYSASGIRSLVIGSNDSLSFKLQSGKIISIAPIGIASGNVKDFGASGRYTIIDIDYSCTEELIKQLSIEQLLMLRIELTDHFKTFEFKEAQKKKIIEAASCILQK